MISMYAIENGFLKLLDTEYLSQNVVWIDLLNITELEEKKIEELLGIPIPTPYDGSQITISDRLYIENENLYLTITCLNFLESDFPITQPLFLILCNDILITVRYNTSSDSDKLMSKILKKSFSFEGKSFDLFLNVLSVMVYELSSIVEFISYEMDSCGKKVFFQVSDSINYSVILKTIGRQNDLLSKSRESLFSLTMALKFLLKSYKVKDTHNTNESLQTLLEDVDSIINFSNFISDEIARILDATLGMVAIEQNNLIKIFSIASIFFLPPTLIASIYGMNFQFMPELRLYYGYPITILLMCISVIIPYRFFRKKKWL